jgi:hypothetical protein
MSHPMFFGPSFNVKLDHGHTMSFKKAMKEYDIEIYDCHQINRKEFVVTFEEPTTSIHDAMEFYPQATWRQVIPNPKK